MKRSINLALLAFALVAFASSAQAAEQSCCSSKPVADTTNAKSCCTKDLGPDASHAEHGGAEATASCCSKDGGTDAHAGHAAETPVGDGTGHEGHASAEPAEHGHDGGGHGGGKGAVMPDAMQLLHNHAALTRTSEDIPNGVRTVTTTDDPALLDLLRRHPREMYAFYEAGGAVRPRDPMFRELSRVADRVTMQFKNIENGIEVVATSDDPEVVKLIRAHARKVDEFVKRGHAALHEGAPLPEDYHPAE